MYKQIAEIFFNLQPYQKIGGAATAIGRVPNEKENFEKVLFAQYFSH